MSKVIRIYTIDYIICDIQKKRDKFLCNCAWGPHSKAHLTHARACVCQLEPRARANRFRTLAGFMTNMTKDACVRVCGDACRCRYARHVPASVVVVSQSVGISIGIHFRWRRRLLDTHYHHHATLRTLCNSGRSAHPKYWPYRTESITSCSSGSA